MRLIFMGTPAAAVPTLRRLIEDEHEIVAVWTQPDRPSGRGNKLTAPPVKEFALANNLTVHQPEKIKTEEAFETFASREADAAIVVAYGRILPARFLAAPRRGCINVHFSLLPRLRGAAPVNWAIVRGERETGVTTMQMDEGLDTGAILLQRATPIGEEETAPQLTERLAHVGAELLSETLVRINEITPRAQDEREATYAPLLRREDGRIDWSLTAREIENRVRGFQPFPNAHTSLDGRRIVIKRAAVLSEDEFLKINENRNSAGELVEAHGERFVVQCGGRTRLQVLEVQPETKRVMSARDFLNGAHLSIETRFE